MFLLYLGGTATPRNIAAGIATVTLSPITAEVAASLTIAAGVATISLTPEGATVSLVVAEVPAASPTAAERLAAGLTGGHQPRSRIVTLSDTRVVRTTYNPSTITLSGTVTYDRTREVRRSASLSLVDVDGALAPLRYGDEFAQGELLRVDRGVRDSGVNLYELLGVFEIRDFEASTDGTLRIAAQDPSLALMQDVGEVIVLASGTSAEDALRLLWEPVLGDGSGWDLDGGGMALGEPRTIAEDDDRLHVTSQLMADLGLEVYMDRNGSPVLVPLADPNALAVSHTYRQDPGEALATSLRRRGDRRPYNRQVVIGEAPSGTLVRGEADITDPTSPIHADRIGLRVAPLHRSAQITTQYQARVVAESLLIERSLWSDSVIWVGVPDPTVEAGEVVQMVDAQTGTDAKYRVDAVTIPVAQGGMQIAASRLMPLFAT